MIAPSHDDAYQARERIRPEQRVRRRAPCELCGGATYCLRFDDGGLFCREVGEAHQWTDHFLGGYIHQPRERRPDAPTNKPLPPQTPAAPADTQHAVYTDVHAWGPLSEAHRRLLTGPGHGLTDEDASRYGSLSGGRALIERLIERHGTGALLGTPGFYRDDAGKIQFAIASGILMPRRDLDGRITGVQVRSDHPNANQRYTWASSTRYDGPSCGSAAHVARPRAPDPRRSHMVGVVEGIKKADVLADRLGYPFIGIAGVGTWRAAEAILEEMGERDPALTTCLIALDRDTKPRAIEDTERARQRLAAAAVDLGYAARFAAWSPDVAKGPDDLLIAGHTFTEDRYRPGDAADHADYAVDTPGVTGGGAAGGPTPPRVVAWLLARVADYWAQIKAWEHLFTNQALPHKAKVVLVHLHKRYGKVIGQQLPDDLPCDKFAGDEEIQAEGVGVSAYEEGRDILLALGVLTKEKRWFREAPSPHGVEGGIGHDEDTATKDGQRRGRDWCWVYGLNGPVLNTFWTETLPHLIEAPLTERQQKAKETREKAIQKAIAEEKPTKQVVARLKRDVVEERKERDKVADECVALTYERDNARDEALAAARVRDQALGEAQRIIRDHQRTLACRGCGTIIDPDAWRCDDCRDREKAEPRQAGDKWATDSRWKTNLEVSGRENPLPQSTNRSMSNPKSPVSGMATEPLFRGQDLDDGYEEVRV